MPVPEPVMTGMTVNLDQICLKSANLRPYTLSFRNFWHERTGLVKNFGNKFGQKGKTWSEVEMILVLTVSYLV